MPKDRILLVEDDLDMLDLCSRTLSSEGYLVKTARNGYEAIEMAKREPFDLLLTDIRIPGLNGLDTYRAIKEFAPETIGVIITGYATMETAIEAVKLGFDGLVTKPFTPEQLGEEVARALQTRRLARQTVRLRALSPLFELSKAFMTTLALDELLNQAVHTAQRETRANRVSLLLLNEEGELTIKAAVGLPQEVMSTTRIRLGEGIAGWVAKQGEPLLLNDNVPLDPRIREAMKSDVISSALCVPLRIKDRVIGVLNLSRLGGTPFAEGHLELVSVVCGQVAIAIENAKLFEELEQARIELEEWNRELERRVRERTKELEEAQERLMEERVLAVGQLGASVGHELRNPLGVIKNSIYYLRMKLEDADGKVRKHLDIMEREITRSNKIIGDLLSLAWAKAPDFKEVHINALAARALSRTPVPENVVVVTELGEDLPPLMADPNQIEQVFINMISNAVQAVISSSLRAEPFELSGSTEASTVSSPQPLAKVLRTKPRAEGSAETPDGGRLEIATKEEDGFIVTEFKDNGCGIPAENLEKIFEPLFTTKAKGIGMGLAVSKRIVEAHNGSIEVESPSTGLRPRTEPVEVTGPSTEFIPSEAEGLARGPSTELGTGEVRKGTTFRVKLPALISQSPNLNDERHGLQK